MLKDMYILLKNNKDDYEVRIDNYQNQIKELRNEKDEYSCQCKKQSSVCR